MRRFNGFGAAMKSLKQLADIAGQAHRPKGRVLMRTSRKRATCKIGEIVFILSSAASFLNYAVGPWVSVAGRETALARGNPVEEFLILDFAIADLSPNCASNRKSKFDNRKLSYAYPLRSF